MPEGTVIDDATDSTESTDEGFEQESDPFAELRAELGESSEDEVSTDESEGSDDDTSDETFTVTVNGEEIEVTRDELLAGYSRQSDYTRKTQELAAERQRLEGLEQLAQALQTDPKVALETLAEQLGVDLVGNQSFDSVDTDDLDDLDPLEKEVKELRKIIEDLSNESKMTAAQRAQAEADAQLDAELAAIREIDPEIDENELLQFALDNQQPTLALAHELMLARKGKQTPAKSEQDEVLERKRNAPPVEGGTGRKGAKPGGGKIASIGDALRAALQEQTNG